MRRNILKLILTAFASCIHDFKVKYKAGYKMLASSWQSQPSTISCIKHLNLKQVAQANTHYFKNKL